MIQSFRLRLALLSASLTGLVLLLFGAGSWWLIRDSKIQRMDTELRAYAEREVNRERTTEEWQAEELRITNGLGLRDTHDVALLVQDGAGHTVYQSNYWPANWDPAKLPWPVAGALGTPVKPAAAAPAFPSFFSAAMAAQRPSDGGMLLAQAGGRAGGAGPGGNGGPGGPGGPGPIGIGAGGLGPALANGAAPAPPPLGLGPGPAAPASTLTNDPLAEQPPGRPGELPPLLQRPLQTPEGTLRPPPVPYNMPASSKPWLQAPGPGATLDVPAPAVLPRPPSSTVQATVPVPMPTTDTRMLPSYQPLPPPDAANAGKPARGPGPSVMLLQREAEGNTWRMALARIDIAQIAIAVNAKAIEADMRGIRNAFLLSLPLALLLTGLASWAFAHRALSPIDKLTRATRGVTASGLGQRIPAAGEDREFVALIEVFNRMLGRLERSFEQAHRFTADAAHELKTPLAIVQGQLERAIHQAPDGSPMQTVLSSILDEVRRLSVISRKLLLLSQADAGHLAVLREPVDLSRVLEELLEDTRMLAPHLQVDADILPGLLIQADVSLLRQVLHNLVSNAIKYNLQGGWIRIGSARWQRGVEVLVSNASNGITPSNRARLFERFFRAEQAHSRTVEGVGLGLSVSREIARAHGGDLTLKGQIPGAVQFALELPL
jgi:signal transduction histidine kinase